jgi:glutamyl-tRNA synthetase
MDDVHFGVDLVVRGQDLWASTLAQLYLATELNLEAFLSASFYHHALLTGDGGQKLSKSSGDTSIQFLRRQGMSSEELYLVLGRMMGLPGQIKTWHDLAEKL